MNHVKGLDHLLLMKVTLLTFKSVAKLWENKNKINYSVFLKNSERHDICTIRGYMYCTYIHHFINSAGNINRALRILFIVKYYKFKTIYNDSNTCILLLIIIIEVLFRWNNVIKTNFTNWTRTWDTLIVIEDIR